ncbi:hypothetical protein [Amycolatopsis sp. cg13]|uniref:hypothetical protein n=1 Tax=Amycolatopsis sp. cg13 TaxID=3238807 RepID=UPI003523BA05
MAGYAAYSVDDQHRMLTAEHDQHVPRLVAAAAMWRDVAAWLDYQCASLRSETNNLIASWPDDAGRLFAEQVHRGLNSIWSWHDPSLAITATLPGQLNLSGSVSASHVVDRINDLVAAIQNALPEATRLRDSYNSLPAHVKPMLEQKARNDLGALLDALVPKYADVGAAMAKAVGKAWDGPRAAAPQGPGRPGPSAADPGPAAQAAPDGPGGPQEPRSPEQPGGPGAPTQPDSAQNLLDDGTKLVDALSQAAQSAQQLLGGSGGDLSGLGPQAGDFNPADLSSMSPADLTDYLRHLDGAGGGLPALAGLDGGGAGGLGGASGLGGAALPAVGGAGPLGNAAAPPGMAGMPVPASANSAAASGTGATGGGMPPMYPPRTAGASPSGGVKPGDAEEPRPGRGRARKPGATPGVPLRGRSGKGRKPAPAAPADRRARPAADDRVLDEDLWQVQEDTEPRRVTWPRQK